MKSIDVLNHKELCCGCGACQAICPKQAIEMKEMENGFIYPMVNYEKCIDCGLCQKVCHFTDPKELLHVPMEVYAATNIDENKRNQSSSGAVFPVFAEKVIKENGVVYGAAYQRMDGQLTLRHIGVSSLKGLERLKGSKYFQSNISDSYKKAKDHLEDGKKVLFTGTPCQIAGLKSFLSREYDNLLTIDIVCHGVPSQRMFHDFMDYLEKKWKTKIMDFSFRAKERGWRDYYMRVTTSSKKKRYSFARNHAYYQYFLEVVNHRENCYDCPFACKERTGDITIGDYWGIEEAHPEIRDSWKQESKNGISCILLNTPKGKKAFMEVSGQLKLHKSDFERAAKANGPLHHPSEKPQKRDYILNLWQKEGYSKVQKYYKKEKGIPYYYWMIRKGVTPVLKTILKKY